MQKSTHALQYQAVLDLLVDMRRKAGLTQRQMADKLGREYSFVWRIEKGERRLDLLEFFWVCEVLNQDPDKAYRGLVRSFNGQGKAIGSSPGSPPSGKSVSPSSRNKRRV